MLLTACALPPAQALAEEAEDNKPSWTPTISSPDRAAADVASKEIWSGAETYRGTWAIYSGVTMAPDGIAQSGLRFRMAAGMSTYSTADALGTGRAVQPFADLLAGYQWQVGSLTLKAFAGATGSADIRTLDQALDLWGATRIGGKASFETWWTIDPRSWASLDFSYASPQTFVWSRARYGYRVWPQVSLGGEAGIAGEASRLGARLGAFARFEWESGEIGLSGGFAGAAGTSAGTSSSPAPPANAPYLTLLWLQRF